MKKRLTAICITENSRRGVIAILTAFSLIAIISFMALGIDLGYVAYEKQKMQIACDAAALAAAMEITHAIEQADENVGDATAYAIAQARLTAEHVAALNQQYVNPQQDVEFGRRTFDPATEEFSITWGAAPANVVRVTCRKDNTDQFAPDARVQTFFAPILGQSAPDIVVTAIAAVESRDIVSVLDFSRSMNFDSYFNSEATVLLSQEQIEANLTKVWNDLGSPSFGTMSFQPDWVTIPSGNWGSALKVRWESESVYVDCESNLQRVKLTFNNGNSQTFTTSSNSGYWQGTGSNSGRRVVKCECRRWSNSWETFDFYDNNDIKRGLGLDGLAYPWPEGSWNEYISMARDTSGSFYDSQIYNYGFRRKFGTMTFLHYVMKFNPAHHETPDLWKTRHYPFHSLKVGQELLCEYLNDLSFNDYLGMVSYDSNHRVEDRMSGAGKPTVDISAEPITNNYQAMHNLIHYKQAAHYSYATNMGGGLKDAKTLLDDHGRPGARGTILLITDGNANTIDSGDSTSLPGGWDWDELFDYNNDGSGDFYTNDSQRRYVLKKAKECVDAGYTIHTMSVGADADTELMRAVAHLGSGIFIEVPGGASTEEMEGDVVDAFRRIAALVPSARMLDPNQ